MIMHLQGFLKRPRRNRRTETIRSLVQETRLFKENLIAPLFVIEGRNQQERITTMPEIERLSLDLLVKEASLLHRKGIQAVALFPCLTKDKKTSQGEEAYNPFSLMQQTICTLKQEIPTLTLITDVALDPYTLHGHDGLVNEKGEILNDETIKVLCQMALAQARSGTDFVAPSDMMDGRVLAIRKALDHEGFYNTGILSYSIKYASSLYAPFRDAVGSHLAFGNKKTYQMNPANRREALLEATLDEEEGADILLVKPATLYLDIISSLREQTNLPIAAYHVSGEYAMVMAAAKEGFLDADKVFLETLLSIKRAGADMIFTYATKRIMEFL